MTILDYARKADCCFFSIVGPHAGESLETILTRKNEDLNKSNVGFWIAKIQDNFIDSARKWGEINDRKDIYLLLISPAISGGAFDTKEKHRNCEYSHDKNTWKNISNEISPVIGKENSTAFLYKNVFLCQDNSIIDLSYYREYLNKESSAINFGRVKGRSQYTTVFAKHGTRRRLDAMRNSERKVIGVLKLKFPYVVWVK